MKGTYSWYYTNSLPNSTTQYQNWLTYDIDYNYPVAPDVYEPANDTHLWNHPRNITIRHWITAYGYENWGAGTDYVDPAANSVVGWPGVQPSNVNYPSSSIYYLITRVPFGIVW
jgi:hypothetical protein